MDLIVAVPFLTGSRPCETLTAAKLVLLSKETMMAVTPTRSSKLVSARDLSKVVEAAVKSASARVPGAGAVSGPVIVKWELVGRVAKNLAQGQELANAITGELGKSGMKVQPAVLGVGRQIICGFFEPINVPVIREF
jgi:hypothetical protein